MYVHELESRDAVADWVAGTTLTPYESRLGPERHAAYLDAYREALRERLPDERPFRYTFLRTFFRARRPLDG